VTMQSDPADRLMDVSDLSGGAPTASTHVI
jgi:hypothetical protein